MGLKEDILLDLLDFADYVLTSASSDQLIKAYDHSSAASKPDTPFLTAQIPDHDNVMGFDEVERRNNNGTPQFRVRGHRWDLAQFDGYGKNTEEWIGTLRRSLKRPDVRRWLKNNGPMGLSRDGPMTDMSGALAGDYERRFTTDFRVVYRFRSDWFDAQTGIAKKLQLRSDSVLRSYETQQLADAFELDMTVG